MDYQVTPTRPFTVIGVRFHQGLNTLKADERVYHYRTRIAFEVGDCAAVEVNGTLKIVDVMEVPAAGKAYKGELKWVVDKIDTKPYLDMLAEEVAVAEGIAALETEARQRAKVKAVEEALPDDLKAKFQELLARKAAL